MANHPHMRPQQINNQPNPITVNPSPVPTQFVVEQAQTPDGPVVVIRIFTPTGQTVSIIPIDAARQVADSIRKAATPIILN